MAIQQILIVDDELLIRNFLSETLRRKNFDVMTAENGNSAVALLKEHTYDMVITDMKMPDITGIDVLKKVKELSPPTVVVVITAFASIETAVEAMRLGAFNYLIKPFSPDTIEAIIEKAQEHLSLVVENSYLRNEIGNSKASLQHIVGESAAMKQILIDIERIAKSNANVFIHGESGTGKEVVAQAIHYSSNRSNSPFIKVNCAAIPETLIESEFFGHEKGAFTGASMRRQGRFELAHNGSLLLDEITEVPLMLQAKLLRAVQEQEFERVGGNKPIKVDVRIISTSNRDMNDAIEKKLLREDLYYRLNVVPIYIPPLRERKEDILPLVNYFLVKMCRDNHKEVMTLSQDAKQRLLEYPWPGNVRELANIIERCVVMENSSEITADKLSMDKDNLLTYKTKKTLPLGITLDELEKRFIIETLEAQNNNRKKAAEQLGISVRTLRNKLNEYHILKSEEN